DKVEAPATRDGTPSTTAIGGTVRDQVSEALLGLGFTAAPADRALAAVLADAPDVDASTLLRKSLALLGKTA
ncbi:Holliday junction branch migration protein RuvA, partial [Streptomyces sp. SID10244]|nr:Holliday junction branch migration protein RuvA [Streptomyces sp. SID10244]